MESIRQLFIVVCCMLFLSCGDNDTTEIIDLEITDIRFDLLAKEYGISKEGLVIESIGNGVDTNYVFFTGRIDGKLWIGGYEKTTKKNIIDRTEGTKLDTDVTVDLGYGETGNYSITTYRGFDFYLYDNSLCFILYGLDESKNITPFRDLYFVNENKVTKKYRRSSFDSNTFASVSGWHEGVFVRTSNSKCECYTMQGEYLFTTQYLPSGTPINYEEYIQHSISNKKITFARRNTIINNSYWSINDGILIDDSNEDIRVDKVEIEKNAEIWTYTIHYTRYTGTKHSTKVSIDINTGEVK